QQGTAERQLREQQGTAERQLRAQGTAERQLRAFNVYPPLFPALLHRHSSAFSTKPACTGLFSIYETTL
ncbi:MAG: hypothetical protein WAV84_13145, partial [Bacteroidota bacterium]